MRNKSPVILYQRWEQMLFLHWRCPVELINASLPLGLTADTFDGQAYLGIIPFLMREIRPRFLPAVPPVSNFAECNLRTYVRDAKGNRGVWFYSLAADSRLAVWVAQKFFSLPYYFAEISSETSAEGEVSYLVNAQNPESLNFNVSYQRGESQGLSQTGSLEEFLLERYLLFCVRQGRLYCGKISHGPHPLFALKSYNINQNKYFTADAFAAANFDSYKPDHVVAVGDQAVQIYPLRGVE